MNIGIDVDGVLVDMEQYQFKKGEKYFSKYEMEIQNPKGYDIQDIFECTNEQRELFWKKYIWSYCLKEPMSSNASKTVHMLRKKGHKIFIITGRAHTTETGTTGWLFRKMLIYWLWKNNFEYDDITFCSEKESSIDKVNICLDKKIDIMLDDKPENLFALQEKTNILCYSAVWNKDFRDLDPYRIDGFSELLCKIEGLEGLVE